MSFAVSGSELSSSSSGQLTFIVAPDYETKTTYSAIVTVYDAAIDGTQSSTQNITVNVSNVNDNAPDISDFAENTEVSNGQTSVLTVTVTDADGDTPILSLIGADAAMLSISEEGAIAFNSSPSFASPTDADGDNVYEFTVKADDSVNVSTKSGTVTVLETNDPPAFTNLESSYTLEENTIDVVTVSASDPDGNAITFSLTGDDADDFTISTGGFLAFAATSNYEIPTDANTNNTYEINVVISDGSNEVAQAVSIIITDVSEAPEFVGLPAIFLIEENDNTVTTLEVADPEGDDFGDITMSGVDAAEFLLGGNGFLRFNSVTGANYEIPTDANEDNIYELVFSVTDTTNNLTREQNFSVQVTDLKDTFSIAGTIFAEVTTALDGDVPKPLNNGVGYPEIPNNTKEDAQTLITPTELAGFIGDTVYEDIQRNEDGTAILDGNGDVIYYNVDRPDPEDWYKINTAPGLQITMAVEDYQQEIEDDNGAVTVVTNKATMLLYDANGILADFSYTSNSTEEYQTINLPESGLYYVVIKPELNNTKYTLALVPNSSTTSFTSSKNRFVEGEFITYRSFSNASNIDLYEDNIPIFVQNENLSQKLSYIDNSDFLGLRVIEFDYINEYAGIFGDDTYLDSPDFVAQNPEQIFYLKHWKILQHYRNINPKLDLEFNKLYKKLGFVQDTYWPYQWGLKLMGVDTVLNASGQEVKNVAVGVIDTGSPAKTSSAWTTSHFLDGGFDFLPASDSGDGDGADSDPTDAVDIASGSHGTHVGTTIAAANDGNNINGFGIHTVPLRVFGSRGTARNSDVVNAMLYAAGLPNTTGQVYSGAVPLRVINMSLGSIGGSCGTAYTVAIQDITDSGVTVVSSSGNSAEEEPGVYGYPSSCDNVISVAAVDPLSQRAYYSTYNNRVDVAAPGGTTGTDLNGDGQSDGILAFDGSESLSYYQGTSMASPHAAAAIAFIYALKPEWDPIQMDAFIQSGFFTDDIGIEGKDDEFGHGLINLDKAFTNLIDGGLDFTYANMTPSSFNFGYTDTEKIITISKVGDGNLSVTQVEANRPSLASIEAVDIDSEGFGTYKVTLNKDNVADGTYTSSVSATFSNDSKSNAIFTYSIGPERQAPNIGHTLLYLIDDEGSVYSGWRLQLPPEGVNFSVSDIDLGTYYWIFSTVIDDDNYLAGYGEIWESYPELSSPFDYFTLSDQDITGSAVYVKTRRSGTGLSAIQSRPKIKFDRKYMNKRAKLTITPIVEN
jgi:serine protease